ncbi:MAG: hypothetical protein SPL37_05875 [Prevotella sp.]|jgi:low affinity Fe/Cu permease|nr:hypothetical protein [Prevotella sp.]MDY6319049.1 hypothetical protein [Prevotella sp.]
MSDYMFRLQNTDMLEADLNDFQHKVERLIRDHKDEAGFPMLDAFRLEQEELDDYLFERQAILDSKGSERSRYTVAGFLIALPVIVISAFPEESLPWGTWSLLVAVAIGVGLFLLYLAIQKTVIRTRLSRLDANSPEAKRFVDEVLKFDI